MCSKRRNVFLEIVATAVCGGGRKAGGEGAGGGRGRENIVHVQRAREDHVSKNSSVEERRMSERNTTAADLPAPNRWQGWLSETTSSASVMYFPGLDTHTPTPFFSWR